jgi:L-threonylcarbamoyladenylate synthase
MHTLITSLGHPIAAPSANPSGKLSPTSAKDVLAGLGGKIEMIIDGGQTDVGIESTIISVDDNTIRLLRPGTVTADEIADAANKTVLDKKNDQITAPGQLSSHYAPNASIRLNATEKREGEYLIGFGAIEGDRNLSENRDLKAAAKNLFSTIRFADAQTDRIAIAPIPMTGVGIAINDRIKRAAAPRDTDNNFTIKGKD